MSWVDSSSNRPCCWERLKAEEKGQPRMRWLDGITGSVDMSLSKPCETVRMGSLVQQSAGSQGVRPRT